MSLKGLHGSLQVCDNPADVASAAADWVVHRSSEAISRHHSFAIALAGGSTPRALYQLLSARTSDVDFARWEVFFGDERACPPGDPQSNFAMAKKTLLDRVNIDPGHVHRMHGESANLAGAASMYAKQLEAALGSPPQLDCVLLGLGENGHTASLFPGDPSLDAITWCTTARADYEPFDRLTLTFPTINAARDIAFLVTGETKRQALQDVIAGTAPAARVKPGSGQLVWFLDADAARPISPVS